jgi:3-(3-hydroxy-phenyl)propionate hydroxylase
MKTKNIETVEVLVAGGGPAGIVAGVALAAAGIDVVVLEAGTQPATDLRASTLHPPTLDYLAELGLAQELYPIGLRSPLYRYFNRQTGSCIEFDLGEIADVSEHPYRLQCEQWKLTDAGSRRIAARMRFSSRVTGAEEGDDGVYVQADTPDGPKTYHARYVIACDGASSVLRKSLGVEFDGFTYEEKFLCLSTLAPIEERLPEVCNVNYMSDPKEWLVLLRAPSAWRVLVPAPLTTPDSELVSEVKKNEVFARLLKTDEDIETLHRTIYRVHQRVAQSYRVGRIILAGDAAHLNNPLGGFGMNSAIHDVRNLVDKLTRILKRGGSEDLLDLYERQRRTVMAEFIQTQTIRNKRAMEMSAEENSGNFEADLLATSIDPVRRREYLLRQSMYTSVGREQEIV